MDPDNMTTYGINDMAFTSMKETHDALMTGIATIIDQHDELLNLVRNLEVTGRTILLNTNAEMAERAGPGLVDFENWLERARAVLGEEGK